GGADSLDDVLIAGTATEIRRQHVEQIAIGDIGFALKHADGQHQEAGRAETALQAVMIHEGLLDRVQLFAICQPFDRPDLTAVRLHGKHQAGAHWFSVHDYSAGPADSMFATDVSAGL